jgi:hypothetical protein
MPADLPPPPRRLRTRPGLGCGPAASRWFLRLFIMPHCIIGACVLLSALYIPLLWLAGTDAPGHVAKLSTSRGKGTKPYYRVEYAYTVNGGEHTTTETVNADEYNALRVGDQYAVRVLESLPDILPQVRGPGGSRWRGFAALGIALFWNGILSLFVWMAWVVPWRTRQLLRYGSVAAGTVCDKQTRAGSKGGRTYVVRYDYRVVPEDSMNPELTAQSLESEMYVTPADYEKAEVGKGVTVIYDPRKPKRSLVYEFAEYEATW